MPDSEKTGFDPGYREEDQPDALDAGLPSVQGTSMAAAGLEPIQKATENREKCLVDGAESGAPTANLIAAMTALLKLGERERTTLVGILKPPDV